MDFDAVRATLEQASLVSLGVGFLIGFVFTFNPVVLASIPVALAYVTKAHEPKTAIGYGGMFILGMLAVQTLLGLIAGLGGQWASGLIGREWGLVLGPVLVLLGLVWPGWIRLPLPAIPVRAKRVGSIWGAAALGAVYKVFDYGRKNLEEVKDLDIRIGSSKFRRKFPHRLTFLC